MSNLKKLSATPISTLKAKEQEGEKFAPKKNFENSRVDTIRLNKLDDGEHKFRIMPPHPGGTSFAEQVGTHWLPALIEVKEDDKPKDNKKQDKNKPKDEIIVIDGKNYKKSRKTIFNSKMHGGTKKDIIEEYMAFADKVIKESGLDEEQVKEKLMHIHGGPYGSNVQGINLQIAWVMYVKYQNEFKKLEITDSNNKKINKVAHSEAGDEPIATDPFTDPEDGRLLICKKDSKAKNASDYYTFRIDSSYNSVTKQINFAPLTEEDAENFFKLDSLQSQYVNSYKRSDFEKALEGLKMFDEEQEIGVFEYEEFLNICDEISAYYPEDSTDAPAAKSEPAKAAPKAPAKLPAKTGDQYDQMSRNELKIFIKDNKLPIVVTTKMDDDDIRGFIRDAMENAEAPEPEEEEAEEPEMEEAEAEEEEEDEPGTGLPWGKDGKDKVETIRNNSAVKAVKVPEEKAAPAPALSMKERMEQMRQQVNKNKKQ